MEIITETQDTVANGNVQVKPSQDEIMRKKQLHEIVDKARDRMGPGGRRIRNLEARPFIRKAICFILGKGAIIILLPLIILVSIFLTPCILLTHRQLFFKQKRIGYRGKTFYLYKFETMKDDADTKIRVVTPFGRFLRVTGLDEFPQILNILKGDMGWVGPRPLTGNIIPKEYYVVMEYTKPGIFSTSVILRGIGTSTQFSIHRKRQMFLNCIENDLRDIENWGYIYNTRLVLLTIKKILRVLWHFIAK